MGKIRTIKPGFFLDEDLAALPPLDRLAFIGLWTQSDKAGRVQDRPNRLKVQILPYDAVNFEEILQRLHSSKFIIRYSVNGMRLIQICTFVKHQRPHHTEAASELPEFNGDATVSSPLDQREHPEGREGKGREGKEGTAGVHRGGGAGRSAPFLPPTKDELLAYAQEKGMVPFNVEKFLDFYETKGWMAGKVPMKDWRAAARNAFRDGWGRGTSAPTAKKPSLWDEAVAKRAAEPEEEP